MERTSVLDLPLLGYSTLRSLGYSLEFQALNTLGRLLPGKGNLPKVELPPEVMRRAQREFFALLRRDAANIREGQYPLSVLRPGSPMEHLGRIPKIMLDGLSLYRRRSRGRTAVFDREAEDLLDTVPRYYRRNFHFQTNGYLSEGSAEIYDHQVEMLFSGGADAMRRLIIPPLRKHFRTKDGRGLHFLEIGAGAGSATTFVRQAFPKARITAIDLSYPYLKTAQKRLQRYSRLDFMQADGGDLPFEGERFDAVYSVFLFHELPLAERRKVLAESRRVLKKRGFHGFVDSMQLGDEDDLEPILKAFPQQYHEPFYRNYISHPMEKLLREAGFSGIGSDRGFYSKVCRSRKGT